MKGRCGALFIFMCALAFLFGATSFRLFERYRADALTITFFDVGQGDAALVQLPGGRTVLVDAGGGFGEWNVGGRVLIPELTRMGILHIDRAVLSHPDQDHAYGFYSILDELSVGAFWFNGFSWPPNQNLHGLVQMARQKGIPVKAWRHPFQFRFGSVQLNGFPLGSEAKKQNDRSLALSIVFGSCSVLFTGDLEKAGERELVAWLHRTDLLKVAHHGSGSSSHGFILQKLRPQVAFVSCGLENRYGHPHLLAIQRLRGSGAQVLRSDFHGYVRVRIHRDGRFFCETAHGSCGLGICGRRN